MIYRITLSRESDKRLINKIQQDNREPEGVRELYDNLYVLGFTESYNQDRIYCVTNILEKNNINFKVTQSER